MAALINNDKIKYEGAKEELRRISRELKMFKEEYTQHFLVSSQQHLSCVFFTSFHMRLVNRSIHRSKVMNNGTFADVVKGLK